MIRVELIESIQQGFSTDPLPDHVKYSIKKAKRELNKGKGMPHESVMKEVRLRFPKEP